MMILMLIPFCILHSFRGVGIFPLIAFTDGKQYSIESERTTPGPRGVIGESPANGRACDWWRAELWRASAVSS